MNCLRYFCIRRYPFSNHSNIIGLKTLHNKTKQTLTVQIKMICTEVECFPSKIQNGKIGLNDVLCYFQDILSHNTVEELLMGMTSQLAEREDSVLCSDVRDKLFGPMEFSRRDLGALNIMRGRDNGLPDYNTLRAYYKLPKIKDWNDINPELFAEKPELLRLLVAAYSNRLDNIDVYVGGMLESYGGPGELFSAVIKEQFARLRDADRLWFENVDNG